MKRLGQIIRRMGFIKDQQGIMNRFIRESSGWQTHLENSRNFISGSFHQTEAETVAVLGSGWLLDVPLEDLIRRFRHIYLVDIHHPVQIRKKTAAMNQVELVEEDLTGGAVVQIWERLRGSKRAVREKMLNGQINLETPLAGIHPDAFVSVNLLDQLDTFLCDYMMKLGRFQQESLAPLRASIQAFHLDWIKKKPGCLITDTIEEVVDRKGNRSSKGLLYTELPVGIRYDSWRWNFDTMGTYHPGSRTHMEVQAVEWS